MGQRYTNVDAMFLGYCDNSHYLSAVLMLGRRRRRRLNHIKDKPPQLSLASGANKIRCHREGFHTKTRIPICGHKGLFNFFTAYVLQAVSLDQNCTL